VYSATKWGPPVWLIAVGIAIGSAGIFSGCAIDLGHAPFRCNEGGNPLCPPDFECRNAICVKAGYCDDTYGCLPGFQCLANRCEAGTAADCGDGKCESSESCSSCQEDCGECVTSCGDGLCTAGETCSNCSKDCGKCTEDCGNGFCDPTENELTCPTDCQTGKCEGDETICAGEDNLRYCQAGSWTTSACSELCTASGEDYTVGCRFSSERNKDACFCGNYKTYGEVCTADKKCGTGLFCGSFDGSSTGFCTKECTSVSSCSGGPTGTEAECNLNVDGKNVCGFICDFFVLCPSGLHCDSANGVCKP
jgi:hypothetical protein